MSTPTPTELLAERRALRSHYRNARRQLSPHQQHQAAAQVAARLAKQPCWQQAKRIALYLANDGELNPATLCELGWQQHKELYLPVIHPFSPTHLLFQRYQAHTPMANNRFDIAEPQWDCTQVVPTAQLDLILLPLVAFDRKGNRLGMGGGFYDRTLASLITKQGNYGNTQTIGLAHTCQQADTLPVQSWDMPLSFIATPNALHHTGNTLNTKYN